METTLTTLEDTTKAAAVLLKMLSVGTAATVVALHGDLGAGKTTFVQQLAAQLGVSDRVTSPTFVVMKSYPLEDKPFDELVHIDAYRIESEVEMIPLRFADIVATPKLLVCIEWAERIANVLPADTVHVTFTQTGDSRTITTTSHG